MTDRITLRAMQFAGIHGVGEEERSFPQVIEVDLELETELARAAASDDVADTIDYGPLVAICREVVEDGDGAHAANMVAIPDQEDKLALQDLSTALQKLPQEQREAIILIGAEGMSYEDAAEALGVKVGTIKSRVNRARNRLAELMGVAGDRLHNSSHADA